MSELLVTLTSMDTLTQGLSRDVSYSDIRGYSDTGVGGGGGG